MDSNSEIRSRSCWRACGHWLEQRFELSRGEGDGNMRAMEGLRGVAVAMVFAVHYATLSRPWQAPGALSTRLILACGEIGHVGVDLFFVLSGFLIYGHLMSRAPLFSTYITRRLRRIYPAFLVVFAIYVALGWLVPSHQKIPGDPAQAALYVIENLLLLPGLLPLPQLITVAWSLSYEMFYYLVVPLVIHLMALRNRPVRWRLCFTLALSAGAFGGFALWGGPVRLMMFLAGILLSELLPRRPPPTWWVVAPLLAAGAVGRIVAMPGPGLQALRTFLLFAGLLGLTHIALAGKASRTAKTLTFLPLRWLGNMSYSYYLLHGLTLEAFFIVVAFLVPPAGGQTFGLWMVVPAFACTLLPPAALFLLVERPLSLQSGKPRRAATPVSAAT